MRTEFRNSCNIGIPERILTYFIGFDSERNDFKDDELHRIRYPPIASPRLDRFNFPERLFVPSGA